MHDVQVRAFTYTVTTMQRVCVCICVCVSVHTLEILAHEECSRWQKHADKIHQKTTTLRNRINMTCVYTTLHSCQPMLHGNHYPFFFVAISSVRWRCVCTCDSRSLCTRACITGSLFLASSCLPLSRAYTGHQNNSTWACHIQERAHALIQIICTNTYLKQWPVLD